MKFRVSPTTCTWLYLLLMLLSDSGMHRAYALEPLVGTQTKPLSLELPAPAKPATAIEVTTAAELQLANAGMDLGPYAVGICMVRIPQSERKHLFTVVWYPAKLDTGKPLEKFSNQIPSVGRFGAEPATGPFPLIAFSHGLSAVNVQSAFLVEHLVSHGYVVAAPDHPGDCGRRFNPFDVPDSVLHRPLELSQVITQMLDFNRTPGSWLEGRIDESRIGASGCSMGGFTALALGGARVATRAIPLPATVTSRPRYIYFRDDRVRAVMAFAPPRPPMFDEASFQTVTIPIALSSAGLDRIAPFQINQKPIYDQLAGPKTLLRLPGATHFSYNDPEMLLSAPTLLRWFDRPLIPRQEVVDALRLWHLAFWETTLKQNRSWQPFLQSSYWSQNERFQPHLTVSAQNWSASIQSVQHARHNLLASPMPTATR